MIDTTTALLRPDPLLATVTDVDSTVTCYSIPHAAELLDTTQQTLKRLCREHQLQLFYLDGPRTSRVTHDDLLALIRRCQGGQFPKPRQSRRHGDSPPLRWSPELAPPEPTEAEVTCYSVETAARLLATNRGNVKRLCRNHGIRLFLLDGPRSTRITHEDLRTLIRLRKSAAALAGYFQD